jgi:hypothetical protein
MNTLGIQDLARELGRPTETLVALSKHNDPFFSDCGSWRLPAGTRGKGGDH